MQAGAEGGLPIPDSDPSFQITNVQADQQSKQQDIQCGGEDQRTNELKTGNRQTKWLKTITTFAKPGRKPVLMIRTTIGPHFISLQTDRVFIYFMPLGFFP